MVKNILDALSLMPFPQLSSISQESQSLKEALFRINFAAKNLKKVIVGDVEQGPNYIFESKVFCELSSISRWVKDGFLFEIISRKTESIYIS